ncbi:Cytochrome P450 monooxygenase [Lachnellula subtilissima]|uniref:Cytochrome P450 monooxygenase n=1 Tax=Lachnellula subtilissima TaxID=602034 RepID=A0A8H8RR50_9HELO|nr:Cytochrome P450 monooxygenase [Lachnellula subtilissima]
MSVSVEEYTYATYMKLVASAFLGCVTLIFVRRRWFSSISDIPGPFLGSFSVLWQIKHAIKGHTEEETIAEHRKHGDFVRIGYNEVSIGHPDAINEVLKSQMNKGDWYRIFSLPDSRYVNQMSEVDAKRHITKTKNVASGYAFSNIIKAEPYVDGALRLFEKRLDSLSEAHLPVNFDEWFNFLGFDIMGEVTFSKQFGFLDQGRDIGDAIANTRVLGIYVAIMGHFWWAHDYLLANPLIGYLNLQPTMHIFDTALAAVDRRSKNDQVRRDMIEQWMDMRKKHPERMEEKEILAAAVANIGAGADTVSATLQALFYNLLRNEETLIQLREEIDGANLAEVPTHEETQQLPFLQACIKEALRVHTPVAFGLPRVSPKGGVTVLGRHFDEGVILSVNPWVIHQRPDIFGNDADVFSPARWMDPIRAREMEKSFTAFGAGYNQCPGRHLAHMELCKTTAMLVRDYDIKQINKGKSWRFETHFTAVPYDWPCYVTRRCKQ